MSSEQTAANKIDAIQGLIYLGLSVFAVVMLFKFLGFSISFSDNDLEKIVKIGNSDRAQFEAFKNQGGLDHESIWKGYKVRSLTTTYNDQTGKLGILEMGLAKSWSNNKLASVDNVKASLSSDCGSNWEQNDAQRVSSMHVATKGNTTCSIQDARDITLVMVMQR